MSERHIHRATAATNYELARQLEAHQGDHLCWLPTYIYYCALQVADCRLADYNYHERESGNRIALVRTYSTNPYGAASLNSLKTRSERWRYHGEIPTHDQIREAWNHAEVVAEALGEPWPPT